MLIDISMSSAADLNDLKERGGTMKIALVTLAGMTIGTLIVISAFQLLKVVIQEMINIASEAWHSPEQH
jgi:hypothetical protein